MAVMRLASTLALAAAAFSGYAAYRRRSAPTGAYGVRHKPEPLQRWEGEGGSVSAAHAVQATAGGRTEDLLEPGSPAEH